MSRFPPCLALRRMRKLLVPVVMMLSGCWGIDGEVLASRDAGVDAGPTCRSDGGAEWPVRLLFGVEQSGRMCIVDPPGSQNSSGLCEVAGPGFVSLSTSPRRVRALQAFLPAQPSWVEAGVAGWREEPWTLASFLVPFQPASSPLLASGISSMQAELGRGNDLQAGLTHLAERLEQALVATPAAERALTSYAVVLISSGLPYPRCAADDTLQSYASPEHPEGVWADELMPAPGVSGLTNPDCVDGEVPPNDWCTNAGWYADWSAPDAGHLGDAGVVVELPSVCKVQRIPDLRGADLNQNAQLFALVDRIVALQAQYGAGAVRVHTVLDFDQTQLATCGVLCQSMFHPFRPTTVRPAGQWLLQQLAARGNGAFLDPADLQPIDLARLPHLRPLNRCP